MEYLRRLVVDLLDCLLKVSEFEHLSRYYVHFWTQVFCKGEYPYSSTWYGLKTHEGWYAIKQKTKTNQQTDKKLLRAL